MAEGSDDLIDADAVGQILWLTNEELGRLVGRGVLTVVEIKGRPHFQRAEVIAAREAGEGYAPAQGTGQRTD